MMNDADLKKQYKAFSEADLQNLTDEGSFTRGKSYYKNNRISEATLREGSLVGRCEGSQNETYRVEVKLVPAQQGGTELIGGWICGCPRGGFCKHVVALLLTWVYKPQEFEIRPPLASLFKDKSREDLVGVITEMVQRQPELENLVELLVALPSLNSTAVGQKSKQSQSQKVDPNNIRRQVKAAFRSGGNEWGAGRIIAEELSNIIELGDKFAEAGQWRNAQTIYATIAAEATDEDVVGIDEEGDIGVVVGDCATGLANCLDVQPGLNGPEKLDVAERLELIKTLWDLWSYERNFGEFETDLAEVIAGNVTNEERRTVESWVRQQMKPGADFSSKYYNEYLVGFLATLKESGNFSDEDLLREYRQAGLYEKLTTKLLELGRTDEAITIARESMTDQTELERFATALVDRKLTTEAFRLALEKLTDENPVTGFAEHILTLDKARVWMEQALALVENRLSTAERKAQLPKADYRLGFDIDRYRSWLGQKYLDYGKVEKAGNLELIRFEAHPSEATYRSVRTAAQLPGQPPDLWASLRPRLLQVLEKQDNLTSLIGIYLEEGQVGAALETLQRLEEKSGQNRNNNYGYFRNNEPSSLKLRVAQAAEKDFPAEAIRFYNEAAEGFIGRKNRGSYLEAITYLTKIKQLYQKRKREAEWQAYTTRLRTTYSTLRAFHEELHKAGL